MKCSQKVLPDHARGWPTISNDTAKKFLKSGELLKVEDAPPPEPLVFPESIQKNVPVFNMECEKTGSRTETRICSLVDKSSLLSRSNVNETQNSFDSETDNIISQGQSCIEESEEFKARSRLKRGYCQLLSQDKTETAHRHKTDTANRDRFEEDLDKIDFSPFQNDTPQSLILRHLDLVNLVDLKPTSSSQHDKLKKQLLSDEALDLMSNTSLPSNLTEIETAWPKQSGGDSKILLSASKRGKVPILCDGLLDIQKFCFTDKSQFDSAMSNNMVENQSYSMLGSSIWDLQSDMYSIPIVINTSNEVAKSMTNIEDATLHPFLKRTFLQQSDCTETGNYDFQLDCFTKPLNNPHVMDTYAAGTRVETLGCDIRWSDIGSCNSFSKFSTHGSDDTYTKLILGRKAEYSDW